MGGVRKNRLFVVVVVVLPDYYHMSPYFSCDRVRRTVAWDVSYSSTVARTEVALAVDGMTRSATIDKREVS